MFWDACAPLPSLPLSGFCLTRKPPASSLHARHVSCLLCLTHLLAHESDSCLSAGLEGQGSVRGGRVAQRTPALYISRDPGRAGQSPPLWGPCAPLHCASPGPRESRAERRAHPVGAVRTPCTVHPRDPGRTGQSAESTHCGAHADPGELAGVPTAPFQVQSSSPPSPQCQPAAGPLLHLWSQHLFFCSVKH